MARPIISVENLGKRYRIQHRQQGPRGYVALRDVIAAKLRSPLSRREPSSSTEDFWALQNVSFNVQEGEVVGIIGGNGAGKSTLLKILSRITEPTTGRVRLRGRAASLLEVGTGFHPELTGRENIFLNGAILGMTRVEIARKFDEIVSFAEVEKFLDTPVKRYSSGMYVRLAFAVAAHLEPEILIVDEVLAVGDLEFQKKCLGKMRDVSTGGRTVLFVSHNMAAVQALCQRVALLHQGMLVRSGETLDIVAEYVSGAAVRPAVKYPLQLGAALELREFTALPTTCRSGEDVELSVTVSALQRTSLTDLCVLVYSESGLRTAVVDLRECGLPRVLECGTQWIANVRIPRLPLVEGTYQLGLYVGCSNFAGDLLDLLQLEVSPVSHVGKPVPYAVAHRGVVEFHPDYSLSTASLQEMTARSARFVN